jgi:hypothetical protein
MKRLTLAGAHDLADQFSASLTAILFKMTHPSRFLDRLSKQD